MQSLDIYRQADRISGFRIVKIFLLLVFLQIQTILLSGQASNQIFKEYTYGEFVKGGDSLRYRMLFPKNQSKEKYPLVIFLHGAMGPELDNESQLSLGGRFFLRDSIRNNYPAYVLFPRCPKFEAWVNFENEIDPVTFRAINWRFNFSKGPSLSVSLLLDLIASIVKTENVDATRIYVIGVSQGGMGVLDLLARQPVLFAAGISICGAGDASTAKRFANKSSLWLIHGIEDDQISVNFSEQYFKKLIRLKSDVRSSFYPGVNHNSWSKAFMEPDFMKWLFSKHK